jgi:ATP-dependent Clp protease adaptor protein ClpS
MTNDQNHRPQSRSLVIGHWSLRVSALGHCASARRAYTEAMAGSGNTRWVGNAGGVGTETLPGTVEETRDKVSEAFAKQWNVIVWNDPVNLMTYVVFVFMKVLGFPKEKATKHMLEVHRNGKSIVATETREKAELYHQQIQAHGLIVTIEQND